MAGLVPAIHDFQRCVWKKVVDGRPAPAMTRGLRRPRHEGRCRPWHAAGHDTGARRAGTDRLHG